MELLHLGLGVLGQVKPGGEGGGGSEATGARRIYLTNHTPHANFFCALLASILAGSASTCLTLTGAEVWRSKR